jgi:SAM-dependent methyltransferase
MAESSSVGAEQARLWNGPSGHAWVESQELLDHVLRPFEALLVEAVTRSGARQVLDVGCGTGSTTLAIARTLGEAGRCTGVDISEPMLALARTRAERAQLPATFIRADAQTYSFEPASVETVVSRFGVMFFEDPVRAFANLRHASAAGAALRMIAWRSAAENPFSTTAERAAAPLLPDLPPRKTDGPGQFAFANRQRIETILDDSGWTGIDIRPIDVECSMPEADLIRYVTRLGPVGLALQDASDATCARVVEALRTAFEPFVHGAEVRFMAACWMLSAANE